MDVVPISALDRWFWDCRNWISVRWDWYSPWSAIIFFSRRLLWPSTGRVMWRRIPDTIAGRCEAPLFVRAEEDCGQNAGKNVEGVGTAGDTGLGVEAHVGVVKFFQAFSDFASTISTIRLSGSVLDTLPWQWTHLACLLGVIGGLAWFLETTQLLYSQNPYFVLSLPSWPCFNIKASSNSNVKHAQRHEAKQAP